MPTADTYITNALYELGEVPVGVTPSSDDLALGLTLLNAMMANWQAKRLDGQNALATFASGSTSNTYATGYDRAIITNLAVEMASAMHQTATPELMRASQNSLRALLPPAQAG